MAALKVLLPQYGMGMSEGEIVSWKKAVGDHVNEGETLVEIEAAKATVEVPSPASGTVLELLAAEGDIVEVRGVIARLQLD